MKDQPKRNDYLPLDELFLPLREGADIDILAEAGWAKLEALMAQEDGHSKRVDHVDEANTIYYDEVHSL